MTPAQRARFDDNAKKFSMFLGHALHSATARRLNSLFKRRFTYSRGRGPDFVDRLTGLRIELTTWYQLRAHLQRYANLPHPIDFIVEGLRLDIDAWM